MQYTFWTRSVASAFCATKGLRSAYLFFGVCLPRMVAGLAVVAVAGCATQTPFESPHNLLPSTWKHGVTAAPASEQYGLVEVPPAFRQDQQLAALLEVVEQRNSELAAAAVRVRKAQLLAGLADNARWPQPGVDASTDGSRSLRKGGPTTRNYGVNASVSYEVDLWGRLATEYNMAQWEAQATEQDRRNVRIALLATTASVYFQLGLLNDQVRLGRASLEDANRTLELVQAQYEYGAASALELAEARQTLRSQQAAFEQLVQQRVEARNALVVLGDGRDLSAYEPDGLPKYTVAALPQGLPVSMLSYRPDLQAAETRLRRSLAGVDAARLSFYPTFSLTATGGGASNDLGHVLSNPIGTLAAALALPFVNVAKARLTTDSARADFDEAAVQFQQSMINAFAEVDNALSQGVQLRAEQDHLEAALEDARVAERLYEARYREGVVALRDWLSAQDRRRQADLAVLQNRYALYANVITARKSLGLDLRAEDSTPRS